MSLSRRQLLRYFSLGAAGVSASGFMPRLAQAFADGAQQRRRHCILLWMTGGPTQLDTFDLKPEAPAEFRGEYKPIDTSAPGLQISEHLPKLAKFGDKLAVLRGLSTKEGDHDRGTYLMRTGHQPGGPIAFPTMGASLSKALGDDDAELPNFVAISPYTAFNRQAFGPGFLGPKHAPLTVGATNLFQVQQQPNQPEGYAELGVDDLKAGRVPLKQEDARMDLWNTLQSSFLGGHPSGAAKAHDTVYRRAVRMMRSEAAKAFDLSEESAETRDAYGRGRFGQGCLMARRLVERGVPFIEVSLSGVNGALGWDTHQNNFQLVKTLSGELDAGWSMLMQELAERGLLESTTIVWLGEFGRTPRVNQAAGRDHFPNAWSCVLAGGGIKGGQAYGKTSQSGEEVVEGKVDVGDVLATLCKALGVDPREQNISEMQRPIRIAEGKEIAEILA